MSRLKEKMAAAIAHVQKLHAIGGRLQKAPDKQISLTDPDARSMATSGRGAGIVGYNVQTAIETKHHLIVAHEVTNSGHDHPLLHKMATAACEALGTEALSTLADRGYFKGEEILACEAQGITPWYLNLRPPATGPPASSTRETFATLETDEYTCPAGQQAIWRFSTVEHGQTIHKYWSSACVRCPIKTRCTKGIYRRITRWEHEAVLERMQQRLDRTPDAMPIRRRTVEHPFGTLGMDGRYAFPNQDAIACQYRDEFARFGLQPKANDADPECSGANKSYRNIGPDLLYSSNRTASPQNLRIMTSETTPRFVV